MLCKITLSNERKKVGTGIWRPIPYRLYGIGDTLFGSIDRVILHNMSKKSARALLSYAHAKVRLDTLRTTLELTWWNCKILILFEYEIEFAFHVLNFNNGSVIEVAWVSGNTRSN